MPLPLPLDVQSLTMGLVNIGSPTGDEGAIADSVEEALRTQPHLSVDRFGNTVVASTTFGHAERVLLVSHLDTVPSDDEVLAYVEMGKLFGLGACDAKGGLAVLLKTASLPAYGRDLTVVAYDGEESSESSGLDGLVQMRPELLQADLAVVLKPTSGRIEVTDRSPLVTVLAAAAPDVDVVEARAGRTTADVLADLGTPAVTYGPGDPVLAHGPAEFVPTAQLGECEFVLRELLKA